QPRARLRRTTNGDGSWVDATEQAPRASWASGSRSSGQRWGYDLLWYLSGVGIESTPNRRSPAKLGDVAQLARAPALQAGGRGFESHRLHQKSARIGERFGHIPRRRKRVEISTGCIFACCPRTAFMHSRSLSTRSRAPQSTQAE